MLAFLVLGFTAGVLNVLRLTKGLDQAVGLGRAIRDKEAAESDTGKTGGDETGETKTKAPE